MPDVQPFIKLALPKGRMEKGVFDLLAAAAIHLRAGSRQYRPLISLPEYEVKILKSQDIVEMLNLGSRDVGFAGADWVAELQADLIELLDTGLDPVRLVAAAPIAFLENGKLPRRPLVIASEYERLTKRWVEKNNLDARFVRSYGATEVFPPEDADCIIDNTASGATLRANHLEILDELMCSSTRLYTNRWAMEDPRKRKEIESLVLLLRSVLQARKRVMLEVNVSAEAMEKVVSILPCMRKPTIASLYQENGYAIKAAVPRADLPRLIPAIKACGGTDIVVADLGQIVP